MYIIYTNYEIFSIEWYLGLELKLFGKVALRNFV